MEKKQQLSKCGAGLCCTIPQRAVEAFHITTKRFFEWSATAIEVTGTFYQSETVVTTRVQQTKNGHYQVEVLPVYVKRYNIVPTKKGGPVAAFEWDEKTLHIRIQIKK